MTVRCPGPVATETSPDHHWTVGIWCLSADVFSLCFAKHSVLRCGQMFPFWSCVSKVMWFLLDILPNKPHLFCRENVNIYMLTELCAVWKRADFAVTSSPLMIAQLKCIWLAASSYSFLCMYLAFRRPAQNPKNSVHLPLLQTTEEKENRVSVRLIQADECWSEAKLSDGCLSA